MPRLRESDVFTPLERDVVAYAEAMSQTPPHGHRRESTVAGGGHREGGP